MNVSNSCNSIVPSWASTGNDIDFVTAIWHCAESEDDPQKEALDHLLDYDESTGHLIWKPRPLCCFANYRSQCYWNAVYGGHMAGAENWSAPKSKPENRRKVCILLTFTKIWGGSEFIKRKLAHRMIWTMKRGRIPYGMVIDHKDRNPFNNKLDNLRVCTQAENMRNKSKASQKFSSEFHGVSLHSHSPTGAPYWTAVIGKKHLGLFKNEMDAAIHRELLIPDDDHFTRRNFPKS